MNSFKILFKMQLKEKLDLSFLNSKKQTLFKVGFSLLGFIAITLMAYVVLYICQLLYLFSPLSRIPLSVMSLIYFIVFMLSFFSCTVGLSKTLYYAKDNQVLITYPVNANIIFFSKMLVYYINEIRRAFSFIVPIFLAYGILSKLSIVYYLWMPVMLILLTAIPVLLGGLLSIPMNYIMRFLNKFQIVKIVLLCLVLAGVVTGVVILIRKIPSNINLIKSWTTVSKTIREFLSSFTSIFVPFYAVTIFLCGNYQNLTSTLFTSYSYIVLFIAIGIIIALAGLNLVTSRPLYLKIMTKQFEHNKEVVETHKKNIYHRSFFSACLYESKRCIRDSVIFSTSIATIIIAPIAILFLNRIYSAINTRLLGDYFTIGFNILVIMLFTLSHNINLSSIYSKDGEALVLNKVKPQRPWKILFPRLFYNFLATLLILITCCSIFFSYSNIKVGNQILAFFMMLCVATAHIVWSAEIDFLNPKSNIFKTEGLVATNPNELKSSILTFAMSLVTFGLTLFFLMDGLSFVWLKLFVFAFAILLLRGWLFYSKSKILFKEI